MSTEMLDIYDDNFQYDTPPIGRKERKAVHKDGDWHKGFHCWIVYRGDDDCVYIVFQRRSEGKEDEAFALDITAAGHLAAGESAHDGVREIQEELGIPVSFDSLIPLGTIIEVAAYNGKINREFDSVFLLEHKQLLEDYKLQFEEVDGLTEFKIEEGIKLFRREVDSIRAKSIRLYKQPEGKIEMVGPFEHSISIDDFGGGDRGSYYIKILVLSKLHFDGFKYLYI